MACSYAGGTGGLPPRPGFLRLTRVEQGRLGMDKACQPGREEIALRAGPAGTAMPALGTGLLLDLATVTRLGQSRAPGVDEHDRPASTHSQTRQALNKHPRRTQLD